MLQLASRFVALGLAAGVLLSAGAAAAEPAPTLAQALDGVQAFYDKVEGVHLRFEQEVHKRYRPKSAPVVVRRGEAIYYISDGEVLWVYEAAEGTAYKGRVQGSELYEQMKFLFGAAKLREEFDATLRPGAGAGAAAGTVELVLAPKKGQRGVKEIVLQVDTATWAIRGTTLIDPAGDRSELRFEGAEYGPIDNPEWFHWTPGPDVRVEDLSRRGGLR